MPCFALLHTPNGALGLSWGLSSTGEATASHLFVHVLPLLPEPVVCFRPVCPRTVQLSAIDRIYLWPILVAMSALCSWKRSERRWPLAMNFWTQRVTQPFSRSDTALEVKSLTQEEKQLSTRLPKSCDQSACVRD